MINDRTDFKYITPPSNVNIDGQFLANYPALSTTIRWQDIGFIMEGAKERDMLCQCAHGNDADDYIYRVDRAIRAQNPVNASRWLARRYANTGSYPEYAYLGTYTNTADPVWGTPMFIGETESVGDILSSRFTDVTSRTRYSPLSAYNNNRYKFLAGDEIYRSICSELSGVPREAEISQAHEIEPEPLIKMQRNMSKLNKVFYGCYANGGWASSSTAEAKMNGRPYLYAIGGPLRVYNWNWHTQMYDLCSTTYGQITDSGSTNWSWLEDSDSITRRNGWAHYGISDTEGKVAFFKQNQDKVRSATAYYMNITLYSNGTPNWSEWKFVLTKCPLTKSGTVTLYDGVYDAWKTSGMTDSRTWGGDMAAALGYTLDPTNTDVLFAIYDTYVNFLEVTYEPNTTL